MIVFMTIGWLPAATAISLLGAAAVLAGVNTLIRPLLMAIALPLNIITFGIASLFANLLALVIASAIIGGIMTSGFWIMLLLAFVIMLADDTVRNIRQWLQKQSAAHGD
jgi:putative membrane protein